MKWCLTPSGWRGRPISIVPRTDELSIFIWRIKHCRFLTFWHDACFLCAAPIGNGYRYMKSGKVRMSRRKRSAEMKCVLVEKVERVIRKNAPKSLSVKELSEKTMVAETFIRREVSGRHEFLNMVRIRRMLEMRARGDTTSLLRAAITVGGFGNYASFYRSCRKYFGERPSILFSREIFAPGSNQRSGPKEAD